MQTVLLAPCETQSLERVSFEVMCYSKLKRFKLLIKAQERCTKFFQILKYRPRRVILFWSLCF